MIENELKIAGVGQYRVKGYAADTVRFTVEHQLLNENTWRLFVDQFRYHTDGVNEWKGEFWGKMMRGGAITYRATGNPKLYRILTGTVRDLLTTQEKSGRISSYPVEGEFNYWDMWCRKYVMLGLMYYLEICKSDALKNKIIRALKRHADYIVKRVGPGKKQKGILKTAQAWGGLNSCSILEPFVKLYALTNEKRYFDFATYIVNIGCCADFNLIETCITKALYPYQFPHVKAYEMMSCLEGVLEYYRHTGEEKYLVAVKNFVEMVAATDYTIIGCSGCKHELFDNSTRMQTEPAKEEIMQETCVTVTFMKLCLRLLALTGDLSYAEYIERSGYNAMLGAVNMEMQMMQTPKWAAEMGRAAEALLPFDSYSPLFMDRRGKRIGGYQQLADGTVYGCCACIGSAGTGIFALFGIMENRDGYLINLYNDGDYKAVRGGKEVAISVRANVYRRAGAKLKIEGNGEKFKLALRVPGWAEKFSVMLNGAPVSVIEENGCVTVERNWGTDEIKIDFKMPVKMHVMSG